MMFPYQPTPEQAQFLTDLCLQAAKLEKSDCLQDLIDVRDWLSSVIEREA